MKLERIRDEILDLRNLISKKENSCLRKWFFPSVFRTEDTINKELDRIENKIQEITEFPVFSSGHAFVCFDSLEAGYKCLNTFQEKTWRKIYLKLKYLFEKRQDRRPKRFVTSTFGKFTDEIDVNMMKGMMNPEEMNILVDQLIEPFDIIWTNVGGDRGLYICRRIICNISLVLILIFLTTPTVNNYL